MLGSLRQHKAPINLSEQRAGRTRNAVEACHERKASYGCEHHEVALGACEAASGRRPAEGALAPDVSPEELPRCGYLPHLHSMARARPSRATPWRHLRHEHGALATVPEGQGPRPLQHHQATREQHRNRRRGWPGPVCPSIDPSTQSTQRLSTVLAQVDEVLQVDAPSPWPTQAWSCSRRGDRELPRRLLQYHALLLRRHQKQCAIDRDSVTP